MMRRLTDGEHIEIVEEGEEPPADSALADVPVEEQHALLAAVWPWTHAASDAPVRPESLMHPRGTLIHRYTCVARILDRKMLQTGGSNMCAFGKDESPHRKIQFVGIFYIAFQNPRKIHRKINEFKHVFTAGSVESLHRKMQFA